MRPLVSVVIAARNAGEHLAEALQSVRSQTYPRHEIVLVDGHSTDATPAIARACPALRYVVQDGLGLAGAWNQGVAAARGELIGFLDSDDRWPIDKLERQVARLQADPQTLAVVGHVRFFASGPLPPHFRPQLLEGVHVARMPGALLARREVFQRIGGFSGEWRTASDVDWFARLAESGIPLAVDPGVVIEKRVHSRNLSYVTASEAGNPVRREILDALRRSVARRRSAGSS